MESSINEVFLAWVSKIVGPVLRGERTDGNHLEHRQKNSMVENRGGLGEVVE